MSIVNSQFTGNHANYGVDYYGTGGYGTVGSGSGGSGGAVSWGMVGGDMSTVRIHASRFKGNSASLGGALFWPGECDVAITECFVNDNLA